MQKSKYIDELYNYSLEKINSVNVVHFGNIVPERHKYALMADVNLIFASLRR